MVKKAVLIELLLVCLLLNACCTTSDLNRNDNMDLKEIQKQIFELQQDQAYINTKLEQAKSEITSVYTRLETLENKTDENRKKAQEALTGIQNNFSADKDSVDDTYSEELIKIQNSPRMLYERALELINSNKIDNAIPLLDKFLELYPFTELADNALYWLGECYYKKNDYYKAIQEFKRILTNYPKGNKVPSALLKIGYAYNELDQTAESLESLQQIIKLYPNDSTYPLAKKKVNQIMKERGQK